MNRKILPFIFLVIFSGITFWYLSGNYLFKHLSINKPTDKGNLLIIEGWLFDEDIEDAIRLFHKSSYKYIITTGVNTQPFFKMGRNGDLVVDVKRLNIRKGNHQLSIEAYSTLANNESGMFEIWADNEKVGSSYTTTRPVNYSFNFEADSSTDSITVSFLNDALYKNQDINFYISSVTIDETRISVNDTLNYYRTRVKPMWKNILASNNAIRLKYVLLQNGISSSRIIPIETNTYFESRTAETAKNTIQKIDSIFHTDTLRIDIFTHKPHSKRTYQAYKKYAPNNMQIGIISSSCYISDIEKSRLKNLKELIGIIYLKVKPN